MAKDTSKPSQLSEEFVQDSGDETDEALAGAGGRGTNGQAATNGNQSADSGDSEAEGSKSESESDSESAESQDESAAESDSSSRGKKRSRDTVLSAPTAIAKRPKKSNFRIPAQAFRAPNGFQTLSTDTSSRDLQGFDNLDGKQVWHISAPASVDLTLIKDLDIGAALRGESILTASGINYGMQPSSDQAEILLLPSGDPVTYKQKTMVNRAFRLRQVANDSTDSPSNSQSESPTADGFHFTAQVPGKKKQPRQQPSSLKYRHAPLGVDKATPETSGDVQLAESILVKAASQRTDASERAGDMDESTQKKKKEKKKRRPKQTDEVTA